MPHFRFKSKLGGEIVANIEENVENVRYSEYATVFHAKSIETSLRSLIEQQLNGPCDYPSFNRNLRLLSLNKAKETIAEDLQLEIPEAVKTILIDDSLRKKDQIAAFNGVSIATKQMNAIFLFAEKQGYSFTNIRQDIELKQYDAINIPTFIRILDDGSVDYSGITSLTEKQLKSIVKQSNYIVARFFTKGEVWHCFVQNKHSIMGEEKGVMGSVPHIHYLSNKFGHSIDEVKSSIKGGHYPHTSVHILLND